MTNAQMNFKLVSNNDNMAERPMRCSRTVLEKLLLAQWKKLSRSEIENTRFVKRRLAKLIERDYGINYVLAENYLSNIERILPMSAAQSA